MREEIPAGIQIKRPPHHKHLFQMKETKRLGLFWIVTAGLLGVGFLVYLASMAGLIHKTGTRFDSINVVYGEKVHASHEMMIDGKSNNSNNLPMDVNVKPEIQVSEQFYDFGEVGADRVLKHTFVIANLGQAPLIIVHAYTTCGCTVADFTSANIPPGKMALMTLQFDPGYHDMHGTTVRRGVMVETNDSEHPLQEIWIQASVK